MYAHDSFDVTDLDGHDLATREELFKESEGRNFTLLIGHLIGLDHAGHTFENIDHFT